MANKRWLPETLFDDLGFRMSYAVEKVLYEQQTEHQHLVLFEHKHFEIGRARVGKECTVLCRSRWSPYH